MKRLFVGLATAVFLLGAVPGVVCPAIAEAIPGGPVPLNAWPGCPEDSPSGPCASTSTAGHQFPVSAVVSVIPIQLMAPVSW